LKKQLLLIIILWSGAVCGILAQEASVCLMSPSYLKIQVPAHGINWLEGESFDGPCGSIANGEWIIESADSFNVFVATDGPNGSGRYWTVTFGIAQQGETVPRRGFCLETSTVGWRTLQRFSTLPLPWLSDRNADGRPEFIIWDSFPLREDASLAEYGLIAWVYQVDPEGILTIDWRLSRELAGEIASEYRLPLKYAGPLKYARFYLQEERKKIARYLDEFASEKCMIRKKLAR